MSPLKFHQSQIHRFINVVTKFSRNCIFTFAGENDFLFLHLTTFKARFLDLRLEIFLHLWWKKFLQLRVIFTNEDDYFTFVVDFYILKFFFTFVVATRSPVLFAHPTCSLEVPLCFFAKSSRFRRAWV